MRKNNSRAKRILVCIFVVLITYISTSVFVGPYYNAVVTEVLAYSYGSKGATITEIQTRLKAWGFYTGNIDGIYGYDTYLAVKKIQKANGLTQDGIAGNMTLQAIGINIGVGAVANAPATPKYTSTNSDVVLLARLINGEARGEPYEGQVAVGAVIMNRMRDPRFPNTLAGVIYQPGAFTAIVDGQINAAIEPNSTRAAKDALNGWDPSGGAVYYFNAATATNTWILSRPLIKIIGKHRFCS